VKAKQAARIFLWLASLVLVIAFSWWLSSFVSGSEKIQEIILRFGYIGIFFVAVVSGFNVVVPLPAISFLPALTEAGLGFWTSIIVITLGMTFGDGLGYLLGYLGRTVSDIEETKIFRKLREIKQKREWLPIVFLAAYAAVGPLPNEVAVIPLAIMGYKFRYIFPAVFIGNLIFNILAAYGLTNLLNIL
jgi:membrane protein YqaA with SNARE-associated domain